MDLGFGNKNQIIGEALAKEFDKSARAQEEKVLDEIHKYDALLEANDSELEVIRERRLEQMKKAQAQRDKYRANGHGSYSELCQGKHGDTAKEFFEASKMSDRMVVHFYRPSTRLCDIFHRHLQDLAEKHLETRFCKINVEEVAEDGASGSGACYLVDKLGVVVMPTLVIIKDRKASKYQSVAHNVHIVHEHLESYIMMSCILFCPYTHISLSISSFVSFFFK